MKELRTSKTGSMVLLVLTLAACGGGAQARREGTSVAARPPPLVPVHASGEAEVRARVGRAGGTLELGNGARLEIPAGALGEEIEIDFSVGSPAREAWDDETKRALGPVLEVEPPIQSSGDPFVVSCPAMSIPEGWAPGDLALGHEEEAGDTHLGGATLTRWQMWPARIEASRFVAEMPELGGHRIQFGVSR